MRRIACPALLVLLPVLASCGSGGGRGPGDLLDEAADAADPGADVAEGDAAVDPGTDTPGGDEGDVADEGDVPAADPGPSDWRLPVVAACEPEPLLCGGIAPAEAPPAAAFRKDFYYPYEQYPEDRIPDPAAGGRVQVAAVAGAGGPVAKVEIDGHDVTAFALPRTESGPTPQEVLDLAVPGTFHWVHVWPLSLRAGEPFFVTFYGSSPWLDGASSIPVTVITSEGVALEAAVPVAKPEVPLTYVTVAGDGRTVLIHLRNEADGPRTLRSLEVQGRDVTDTACVPSRTLRPGEAALWSVPLCHALQQGDPWTVVAYWHDAPPSVGAGRVVLPHYPIEAWVTEDDCPYPGANWDNFLQHREKGFDTLFLRSHYADRPGCNGATARRIVSRAAHLPDQHFLLDEWAPVDGLDTSRLARLLGDEVDTDEPDKPWRVSQDAKASWVRHPRLTTYIGGARHRRMGRFAGVADLQGMDIYSASCGWSILEAQIPPLRATYDYCRAVRANQAPGPLWIYAQGLWSGREPDGSASPRHQQDPPELKVQAMSVAACGAKGLMYFQTDLAQAKAHPDTWEAMGEVNRDVRAVRAFLREGDVTDGARAGDGVLVGAVRARDAIVVPVVDVKADQPLDYIRCLTEPDPHWVLGAVTTDVRVAVPDDFAVAALYEVRDGLVVPLDGDAAGGLLGGAPYAVGREVVLPGVAVDAARPYRLFVLARTADVADRMRRGMEIVPAGAEPEDPALPAVASCPAAADACTAPAVDLGIVASLRKDFFHPYEQYPEAQIPDPVDGGRVHVVAIAAASGPVTRVEIRGHDATALIRDWGDTASGDDPPPEVAALTDDGFLQWVHVWPRVAVAGQPIWIAFHSTQPWLDQDPTVALRVATDEADVVSGSFVPSRAPVPFTWVTTDATYGSFIVHLRNTDAVARRLDRLVLNGRDVTDRACIPSRTVAPGQAVLWTVPLCEPVARGDPWTVVAQWEDAPPSVAGGRVVAVHFPIHTWPKSYDCPFPGASEERWLAYRAQGIDMPFLWKQTYADYEGCNGADAQAVLAANDALAGGDQWLMVEKGISLSGHDTSRLASFVGDEPDSKVGAAPWAKASHSIRLWGRNPEVATYVGGSRHRHNGAFAGVTDVQGFDCYVSACAPYILEWGNFPPLRMPFDYSRAVRFNHMPWPTWFYSHGLLDKTDPVREPSASEIWVQALSPVAAGAKGLMYFQMSVKAAERRPATWEAIGQANRMIRGVRALLLEGDPTGQAVADHPEVLTDAIRARDAIVVPVVDAAAAVSMNDIRCLMEGDPHWVLADIGTTVRVPIPDDFPVVEVFEVQDGEVVPPAGEPFRIGRDLYLPSIALGEARPARLFVIAADRSVADRVREGLAPMPVPGTAR